MSSSSQLSYDLDTYFYYLIPPEFIHTSANNQNADVNSQTKTF